jgi:voltage-gated potassium channel Kch
MTKTFRSTPGNPYKKQSELLGRLWRRDPLVLFGVERWFLLGLATVLLFLPAMAVRWLGGQFGYLGRKVGVELWVFGKPVVLLAILYLGVSDNRGAAFVSIVMLVDLYAYLLGLVFLRRFYVAPASYGRSVILLGVNLLESALGFAVLYIHFEALAQGGAVVRSWSKAVYFSVITAATIGYGDIVPGGGIGRLIVVTQALSSFLFVAIILATFVANLSAPRGQRANKRLHPTAAERQSGV